MLTKSRPSFGSLWVCQSGWSYVNALEFPPVLWRQVDRLKQLGSVISAMFLARELSLGPALTSLPEKCPALLWVPGTMLARPTVHITPQTFVLRQGLTM